MAKKLRPEHIHELYFLSNPQLSPDAKQIAYVQSYIDPAFQTAKGADKEMGAIPRYKSQIYLARAGEKAFAFTSPGSSASQPKFSPDSKQLAFISDREGDRKLFVMALAGGEARALNIQKPIQHFLWHPAGRHLILVLQESEDKQEGKKEDKKAKQEPLKRHLTRVYYRGDGLGFVPREAVGIYRYDLKKDEVGGVLELKTNPQGIALSADGDLLYIAMASSPEAEDQWQSGLWQLKLKNGKLKELIPDDYRLSEPYPSPDGSFIAFFAASEKGNWASPPGLWLAKSDGSEPRLLTGEAEASPSTGGDSRYGAYPNPAIWQDEKHLLFNLNAEGRSHITRLNIETLVQEPLTEGDGVITSYHHVQGQWVYSAETPSQPGEIFWQWGDGLEQISHSNQAFVKRYGLIEAEPRSLKSADDSVELSYWSMKPQKPRKDKALVLEVHGGPHTNYGYGFYFEFQLLAAQGYEVIYGNPRGSSSYGSAFRQALLGRYGSIDADDVLSIARDAKALAEAESSLENLPIHLTGGSYGGFMTNWLIGHTNEFKSAVTQRSISNWLSFYGTSDIGYRFTLLQQGGNPWEDTERLWQQSPLKYVANITTPLLILHSEADYRCPIEQAEQFYTALKQLDKAPCEFIRFPAESHELSRSGRPDRRVARLEALLEWFKRFV
ncbi:MAG: S9 family peptidase [Deinococcales bacterium]